MIQLVVVRMDGDDTDIVEKISNDFIQGSGPCKYCPKRDDDCYATPFFGYGRDDAEVMIVAEAAGGTRTIRKEDTHLHGDRKREWKNYSETGLESEEKPEKNQVQPIENLPIKAGRLPEILNSEFSTYYTNSVKCNDIHSSEDIPDKYRKMLNGYGKRRCLSHLDSELRDVEPSVVIVMGNSNSKDNQDHLELMFNFLGLKNKKPNSSKIEDYVHNSEFQSDQSSFATYKSNEYSCHVIPSSHFSYGFYQYDEYTYGEPDDSGNEAYCTEMVNAVRAILDD